MKRVAALAGLLMVLASGAADARCRDVNGSAPGGVRCWGGGRGGTEVVTTAPSGGLDLSTVLLLGAMGGGTGDLTGILPLLALQGQQQTTVVETRRRRRF
jgi:hypothetical protein